MAFEHTTFKQRAPLYEDIESLITVGFLSHQTVINDVVVCLRTLSPGDFFMLRSRVAPNASNDAWKLWAISSAAWLVGGVPLLDDPSAPVRLWQSFRGLPKNVQNVLYSVLLGLFQRQQAAQKGLEAFCYENHSRYLWKSYGQRWPGQQIGIPGVEKLGINSSQSFWVVCNQVEDQREQRDVLWESAKLITSASSPSGVKKLDQHDTQRKAQETSRRQRVQDTFYYQSKGLLLEEQEIREVSGRWTEAKSVEDLEDEMRRWVVGEQDAHDRVVAEYKQRAIDRMREEEEARQARLVAIRHELEQAEMEEGDEPFSRPLVGYTAQQLAEILQHKKPGPAGLRQVQMPQKDAQYLYGKYLAQAPSPGSLRVEDGKLVGAPVPEEGDLASRIANRAVPFHTEQED